MTSPNQSLPSQFLYEGFAFHLLDRAGEVALFRKSKHQMDFYEVVIMQLLPAKAIFGKDYPAREAMPASESWGTHGWSLPTIERAWQKFGEVVRSRQEGVFSPRRTAVGPVLGVGDGLIAPSGPEWVLRHTYTVSGRSRSASRSPAIKKEARRTSSGRSQPTSIL